MHRSDALPIFSPTVTTMRFQPIIVPNPSAMATAALTQVGMNLVMEWYWFTSFEMESASEDNAATPCGVTVRARTNSIAAPCASAGAGPAA